MSYLCIVGVAQLGNIISRQSHFTNDGQGIIIDELPWHQDIAYALISISSKLITYLHLLPTQPQESWYLYFFP